MYAPEAGIIDLGSEQKIMSVTLKPRFGYLEIFSLPEQDAKVFINNELAGQTPYKSDRMPLQEYRIRIEKEFFFLFSRKASLPLERRYMKFTFSNC